MKVDVGYIHQYICRSPTGLQNVLLLGHLFCNLGIHFVNSQKRNSALKYLPKILPDLTDSRPTANSNSGREPLFDDTDITALPVTVT
jgi:hypothetical protein